MKTFCIDAETAAALDEVLSLKPLASVFPAEMAADRAAFPRVYTRERNRLIRIFVQACCQEAVNQGWFPIGAVPAVSFRQESPEELQARLVIDRMDTAGGKTGQRIAQGLARFDPKWLDAPENTKTHQLFEAAVAAGQLFEAMELSTDMAQKYLAWLKRTGGKHEQQ